jgi:hypothetical protein
MKHLKTYKLFESFEELESKIKECFVGVSDMDINIKYDGIQLIQDLVSKNMVTVRLVANL